MQREAIVGRHYPSRQRLTETLRTLTPNSIGERSFYREPPPKKPLASRSRYARTFGSGSAPITIAPGRPQGVQQTIFALGVLRGMTVMPGVGFGYPCSTYVPCLFAFRASAEEETEMPRAQTSSPSMIDVLLLAMTMEFLHRFLSEPGDSGAYGGSWANARAVPQSREIKRKRSVSRGFPWGCFPSGSKAPLYHAGLQAGPTGWPGVRSIHKQLQCVVKICAAHLN